MSILDRNTGLLHAVPATAGSFSRFITMRPVAHYLASKGPLAPEVGRVPRSVDGPGPPVSAQEGRIHTPKVRIPIFDVAFRCSGYALRSLVSQAPYVRAPASIGRRTGHRRAGSSDSFPKSPSSTPLCPQGRFSQVIQHGRRRDLVLLTREEKPSYSLDPLHPGGGCRSQSPPSRTEIGLR